MKKIIEFDSLEHLYESEYETVRSPVEISYHRGFGIKYSTLKNGSYAVKVTPDSLDKQACEAHKLIYNKVFGKTTIARLTYKNHPDSANIIGDDIQAISKNEIQAAIEKAKKAIDKAINSLGANND